MHFRNFDSAKLVNLLLSYLEQESFYSEAIACEVVPVIKDYIWLKEEFTASYHILGALV